METKILKLLKSSIPLKTSEIAEKLKLEVKEVTKTIKNLKKEKKIISPKRCLYTVEKKEKESVNKKEFVELYKEKCDFKTKTEAEANLNAFMELVGELLESGKEVAFTGWGKFQVVHRVERTGRNPKTGEKIKIAAKNQVKFKPGKKLEDKVN